MAKFKVGDVVKPSAKTAGYIHTHLIEGNSYTVIGHDYGLNVSGKFNDYGNGECWGEDWFELAESDASAESLRNSILDIHSKREALQKEISLLDEQEKEAVEKLKEQGFVLYEGNVSKESAVTEKKVVLYAEDIEEDMTNYENWKNGDILEVIAHGNPMVPFGALVKHDDCDGADSPYTKSEYNGKWAIRPAYLKFHSRPVK